METTSSLRINDTGFRVKIKRAVRNLLDTSPELNRIPKDFVINGISHVTNPANPIWLRVTWGIIFLGCTAICVFQIQARFSYYISEPVVVDVKIEEQKNVRFPSITIASTDTAGTERLYKEHNIKHNQCSHPVKVILEKVTGTDVSMIWSALNLSQSVAVSKIISRKYLRNVTWKEEYGKYGIHLRFDLDTTFPYNGMESKFQLKINKQLHSCKWAILTGSIQSKGMPGDRKNAFMFNTMTSSDLLLAVKQYTFLNRRGQLCIDDEAYKRCWEQCTVEKFGNLPCSSLPTFEVISLFVAFRRLWKWEIVVITTVICIYRFLAFITYVCRFPFIPAEVKKPMCLSGHGTGRLYGQTAMEYTTIHCKCPRRCQEYAIRINMRYIQDNENVTVVNMYLVTNRVAFISERFAYDIISFCSDMGGTLGLCLGLSVLSIFDVLQNLSLSGLKKIRHKNEDQLLFNEDSAPKLVKDILSEELHKQGNKRRVAPQGSCGAVSRIWCIILSIAIISSCLFIYIRVAKYLSEPTHMTVQIVYQNSVYFPNLTICSLSAQIVSRLKDLAKKRKQFRISSFNLQMEDWCELQLVDLLDDPIMTAEKIWEESSVFNEHESSVDVGKMLLNKSYTETVSMLEVYLPEGRCAEVHIGKQPFAGSTTQYSRAFKANGFLQFKEELMECDRHYQMVFITPPDEIFHLNSRLLFPSGMRTLLILDSKKATLWNTKRNPCVDQQEAQQCRIRCLHGRLEKKVYCRLPYMPSTMNNLRTCTTSQTGKQAQEAYLAEVLNFDQSETDDCGCIRSCKRTITMSSMYVAPHGLTNFTLFTTFFFNNIYEHVVEVPTDSLPSLLCDVGGNLGLTLGASVLSLFDVLQSTVVKLLAIIKER